MITIITTTNQLIRLPVPEPRPGGVRAGPPERRYTYIHIHTCIYIYIYIYIYTYYTPYVYIYICTIYIYIYIHIHLFIYVCLSDLNLRWHIPTDAPLCELWRAIACPNSSLGWHNLSNATCLMRPHLFSTALLF